MVADRGCELHLDRHDSTTWPFNDQVDLAGAILRPHMSGGGIDGVGIDANGLRREGFKQGAEPGASCRGGSVAPQEAVPAHSHQPSSNRRINEVVPRCVREPCDRVEHWDPGRQRFEDEQPSQLLPVAVDRAPGGLVMVAGCRGVKDGRVRGIGCSRSAVGGEPGSQRAGPSNPHSVLGQLPLDDARDVTVELEPPGPFRESANARETGAQNLIDIRWHVDG